MLILLAVADNGTEVPFAEASNHVFEPGLQFSRRQRKAPPLCTLFDERSSCERDRLRIRRFRRSPARGERLAGPRKKPFAQAPLEEGFHDGLRARSTVAWPDSWRLRPERDLGSGEYPSLAESSTMYRGRFGRGGVRRLRDRPSAERASTTCSPTGRRASRRPFISRRSMAMTPTTRCRGGKSGSAASPSILCATWRSSSTASTSAA